jgi:hypothetical protein
MASAADALAAANAATAVITATDASIDAIEIGQTAIATQLAQFLALVQGGGAGGGGAGGGGGGGALAVAEVALAVAEVALCCLHYLHNGGGWIHPGSTSSTATSLFLP